MSEPGEQAGEAAPGRSAAGEDLAAAYDRHAAPLYRYALIILMDHAAAEDAVQQAFAKLAGRRGGMAGIASSEDYLRTAVRHECWRMIDRRRRHPETVELSLDVPLFEPVDRAAEHEEERLRLEAAMKSLPPDQREVVYLKVYEGLTFQKIADELHASINTVSGRYRYALEKLRCHLSKGDRNEEHTHAR